MRQGSVASRILQYCGIGIRYAGIVIAFTVAGCASYPEEPPDCHGEWQRINDHRPKPPAGQSANARQPQTGPVVGQPKKRHTDTQAGQDQRSTAPATANQSNPQGSDTDETKPATEPQGFNVYWRGDSAKEATAMLEEVKAAGISEHFKSGKDSRVIYFGRYGERDSAEQRAARVSAEIGENVGVDVAEDGRIGETNE